MDCWIQTLFVPKESVTCFSGFFSPIFAKGRLVPRRLSGGDERHPGIRVAFECCWAGGSLQFIGFLGRVWAPAAMGSKKGPRKTAKKDRHEVGRAGPIACVVLEVFANWGKAACRAVGRSRTLWGPKNLIPGDFP